MALTVDLKGSAATGDCGELEEFAAALEMPAALEAASEVLSFVARAASFADAGLPVVLPVFAPAAPVADFVSASTGALAAVFAALVFAVSLLQYASLAGALHAASTLEK